MENIQNLNNNKHAIISRNNNFNCNFISNNNNSISKNINNDFISYKLNKITNKKSISETITTTIKYEYKTFNNTIKNDNNIINKNSSNILRSQSRLINNKLIDNFSDKKIMKIIY